MGHPFLGAVISERQQGPALRHHLLGALGDRRQRIAADQHRPGEIVLGGVDIAAIELVAVGKRDGMHHEIERSPQRGDRRECRVDGRGLGDVAMAHDVAADLLHQRLDAALECLALIREGERGAVSVGSFCDAPGDGTIVRHPHDQAALAAHDPGGFRHDAPRFGCATACGAFSGERPPRLRPQDRSRKMRPMCHPGRVPVWRDTPRPYGIGFPRLQAGRRTALTGSAARNCAIRNSAAAPVFDIPRSPHRGPRGDGRSPAMTLGIDA